MFPLVKRKYESSLLLLPLISSVYFSSTCLCYSDRNQRVRDSVCVVEKEREIESCGFVRVARVKTEIM